MHWAVIHLIHTRIPHEHIARLFILHVPDGVGEDEVRRAVDRAGLTPHEFGIRWANHYVAAEPEWPDEVVGQFSKEEARFVYFEDLLHPDSNVRRVTVRVSQELYTSLHMESERRGITLNALCVEAFEKIVREGREK